MRRLSDREDFLRLAAQEWDLGFCAGVLAGTLVTLLTLFLLGVL